MKTLTVQRVDDFELTGDGCAAAWQPVPWNTLTRMGSGPDFHKTQAKTAWSDAGLYFLFDCEDRKLACTNLKDDDDIYTEDVVEVFLWPDESRVLYFEYELSPMNVELPILIPNLNGTFLGWKPWHYEGDRRVRRATAVRGGPRTPGAAISGWTAEFFIPFKLFLGIASSVPGSGTEWRANMYRNDYDQGPISQWAWCTDTGVNYHTYKGFGRFVFGG